MTYLGFHLIFILGPTALLTIAALRRRGRLGSRVPAALFGVAPVAVLFTARWDQYLIANRVWWYGENRVIGTWFGVPYEEYAFMALQPILTGALLLVLLARRCVLHRPASDARTRLIGVVVGVAAIALGLGAGVPALRAGGSWTYVGLIMVWALPACGALFMGAWSGLSLYAREAVTAWAAATLYLCVADRIAIGAGVWTIGAETSTGWLIGGLPMEEALFFALTNLLVVAGAMLFFTPGLNPSETS